VVGESHRRIRLTALALALVAAHFALPPLAREDELEQSVAPAWIEELGYAETEIYEFSRDYHGFALVEGLIDGSPCRFVFDTGNMAGLAINPATANYLGLVPVGAVQLYDSAGSPADRVPQYRPDRVLVLGRQPVDPLLIESGPGVPGLAGPAQLGCSRFTLDFGRGLIALADTPAPVVFPERLKLLHSPDYPMMILVYVTVAQTLALAELDTGKSRTCVDPDWAERMGLEQTDRGILLDGLSFGGRDYRIPAAKTVSFRQISSGLPEPIVLGLGVDVLASRAFTVDYAAGVVLIHE